MAEVKTKWSASGAFTGTGANADILCGFKPTRIEIVNTTQLCTGVWNAGMPDAAAYLTDDTGAGTVDESYVTSAGITPLFNGFRIGTNANLNTASDVTFWHATR